MDKVYDREEVIRTLDLFVGKGNVAEIRIVNAFGSRGRTDSGYFNDFAMAAGMLQPYAKHAKNPGIYFVLNPFSPELIARASNRFCERAENTTQDSDILCRKWLFIDCDPCRKAGISSNGDEYSAAYQRVKDVGNWLTSEMQFSEPIIASSGNGYHLHFRVNLSVSEESTLLVQKCLHALAAKFDDDFVKIDTKVFNASRICKLYGTMARKGDFTPDRPHRLSRIISAPEVLTETQMPALYSLQMMAPADSVRTAVAASAKKRRGPKKSVLDRAAAYLKKVPGAISGQGGHDWTFHAACLLVIEFDLSVNDAFPLLQEWNEKCEPPWSDSELRHKLEDADKITDERGSALKSDRTKWEEENHRKIVAAAAAAGTTPVIDPLASDKNILNSCGITYVAQHDDTGFIEIFSSTTQKFSIIKDPAAVKYEQMILACGPTFRQMIRRNDADAGMWSLAEFRSSLAVVASENSALDDKLGVGIWENSDSLIVVNSRRMGILNCRPELQITSNPVLFGTAYDIGDRCDWVDLDRLQRDIESVQAKSGQLYCEDVLFLRSLFDKWKYLSARNVFPEVLAGMILATFTQTLWSWRPQIFLTGQAYAGKSTMFKMIAAIFGPLCKMSSNSSAAGLRQFLACSGRIVLCDELEKSRHRKEILEMIRASGRGDESFRGTSGHQYRGFRLQHTFWCASIESGLQSEADQSRFIVAELKKVDGRIDIPTIDELTALGSRLISVAICSFREARRLMNVLLENRLKNVHGRICESYAVPCSMYAAALGMPDDLAIDLFHCALSSIGEGSDIESDSDALLQEIMLRPVMTHNKEQKTVADCLRDNLRSGHEQDLRKSGIYLTDDRLFIHCKSVQNQLLTSDWKDKRIDTLLLRLNGSERVVKRFGSSVMRFISIPRTIISSIEMENEPAAPSFEKQPSFESQAMAESTLFSSV